MYLSSYFFEILAYSLQCAMTVNTRVIKVILQRTDLPYVEMTAGLRLQVIPDIRDLPYCQKHQSAAFVAAQQLLVVWEDDPKKLLDRAAYIQDTLMAMIWGPKNLEGAGESEKKDPFVDVDAVDEFEDLEKGEDADKPRQIVLIQAMLTAGTMILVLAAVGSGWRNIAIELFTDKNYLRVAFIACIIPQIWLALVCHARHRYRAQS
jgi:hypothetical protein